MSSFLGIPMSRPLPLQVLGLLVLIYIVKAVYRFVEVRLMFRRLRARGYPVMPHSFLFGHLHILFHLTKGTPSDMHANYIPQILMENWPSLFPKHTSCPALFYVDLWPMGPPTIFTLDPSLPAQAAANTHLTHHPNTLGYLNPLTQNLDIVSSSGPAWRLWRPRLGHGFASKNIIALIPGIIDEVVVFRDILRARAGSSSSTTTVTTPSVGNGDGGGGNMGGNMKGSEGGWGPVFPLEPVAVGLTFDVIARAALDMSLGEQTATAPSPFRAAMEEQLSLCLFEYNVRTLPQILSPVRHWKIWRNTRVMRRVLLPRVLARLEEAEETREVERDGRDRGKDSRGTGSGSGSHTTIVDHAVRAFRREQHDGGRNTNKIKPDADFVEPILANLKVFIFAGHDTTASTLCWVFHHLATHPQAAATLRAELDAVLGPTTMTTTTPLINSTGDTTAATVAAQQQKEQDPVARRLRENPYLLNQLPYTSAFIKEVLRLNPSSAIIRVNPPNNDFVFRNVPSTSPHSHSSSSLITGSECYPTKGFMIWDAIMPGMRYPSVWVRGDEFLPERWLAGPGDPLYVRQKTAWRAFGLGGRQCIGQELAITEIKLVLALVAREVEVECAWGEWDAVRGYKGPKNEMLGHRCYHVGKIVPHLSEGMPVHVRLRT